MITLDASVAFALLWPGDVHHEVAKVVMKDRGIEGFAMHPVNLAEVLVGGVRAGRGAELLSELEGIGLRVPDRSDGEALRLANLRVATGLKLPDCCALDVALTTGSALATFDDALGRAARQRQVAVVPDPGPGDARP